MFFWPQLFRRTDNARSSICFASCQTCTMSTPLASERSRRTSAPSASAKAKDSKKSGTKAGIGGGSGSSSSRGGVSSSSRGTGTKPKAAGGKADAQRPRSRPVQPQLPQQCAWHGNHGLYIKLSPVGEDAARSGRAAQPKRRHSRAQGNPLKGLAASEVEATRLRLRCCVVWSTPTSSPS